MKNWVPPDLGYSLQISAVSLQISAEFLSCFLKKQTKKKTGENQPHSEFCQPTHPRQSGARRAWPKWFLQNKPLAIQGKSRVLGKWQNKMYYK